MLRKIHEFFLLCLLFQSILVVVKCQIANVNYKDSNNNYFPKLLNSIEYKLRNNKRISTTDSASASINEESSEHITEIHLDNAFKVVCPHEILPNNFKFERMIFNRSLHSLEISVRNKLYIIDKNYFEVSTQKVYNKLFAKYDHAWEESEIEINFAKFHHTGRYYCIYSENSGKHDRKFLVTSAVYIIFDGKLIQ